MDAMTNAQVRASLLEAKRQKAQLRKRELYQRSLWDLCKLIGFNDLGNMHQEVCYDIETSDKLRQLYLLPRGHFKTSVITQANAVMKILNNPNIRILIASSTLDNAKKSLKVIKDVFWSNMRFRSIFPEFCPPDGAKEFGTQTQFTVPNRTDQTLAMATVECAGNGQVITGRHYDEIIVTDICTPENTMTPQQITKTIEWVAFLESILVLPEKNKITLEGTRYAFADVYGVWEKRARKKRSAFLVHKHPALIQTKDGETPLFPERFSIEGLYAIRDNQGSAIFSGQYMLDPIDSEATMIKREEVVFKKRQQVPRAEGNVYRFPVYMTIDPAVSQSKTADDSVITVSMFDDENNEWVVDIEKGHWKLKEFINKLVSMYKRWKPESIGIETIAFQKLLLHVLDDVAKQIGEILPIIEVKRSTRTTKEMRIRALQPRFAQKKIFFCDDLDKAWIEDSLIRYIPGKKNNKDDLLDTLADMEDIKMVPYVDKPDEYSLFPMKRYIDFLKDPHVEDDEFNWDGDEDLEEYDVPYV